MDLARLAIISQKEFSDHIRSRRLILILIIFCLILGIKAANGVADYNESLEAYKSGTGSLVIFLPSAVEVFSEIVNAIGSEGFGLIVGLALGFDLLSGDKEGRTLKTILSRPIYRDELINGKAIGGIAALILISATGFFIVLAVMLVLGIVPDFDELFGIGILWIITLLFMITAFSLALMTSVITKTSSNSLILSLAIIFLILFVLPLGVNNIATELLIGQPPLHSSDSFSSGMYEYQEKQKEYYDEKNAIIDLSTSISIKEVYEDITLPIVAPSSYQISMNLRNSNDPYGSATSEKPGVWSLVSDQFGKVIIFIMWPVIFFGIAYIRFMRLDLR
ncbi:ABC transporter permease [Methanolacinia petrolearia]|uniref:ABC transporter permease n=1 Tax=Methanolacinia petrolearia TaxID=54120 RepID=UPI003BAC4D01